MVTISKNTRRKIAIPLKANHRRATKTRLRDQKAVAKLGMAGSLGVLLVSGFIKFQGAKSLHVYSGFGLLAFTVWHHVLNQAKTKPMRR